MTDTEIKTSIDEIAEQQKADPVAPLLERAGVASVDELVDRANESDDLRKQLNNLGAVVRQLKKEKKDYADQQRDEDYGFSENTDPVLKRLATKQEELESSIRSISLHLSQDDGDRDLAPYLRQAQVKHPGIMAIEDDESRNDALMTVARAMRDSEVAKGSVDSARREGQEQSAMAARATFTGGGPGAGQRQELTDDEVLKMFDNDIKGKRVDVIDKIKAKYVARYPHLFGG